jgi:hypothetical protein
MPDNLLANVVDRTIASCSHHKAYLTPRRNVATLKTKTGISV